MRGASPQAKWLAPPRKSFLVLRRGLSDVCGPSCNLDFLLRLCRTRNFEIMRCSGPAVSRTSRRASLSMCIDTISGQWTVLRSGPCVYCLIFKSLRTAKRSWKWSLLLKFSRRCYSKSAWSVYSNGSRKIWRNQPLGQHLIMLLSCVLIILPKIVSVRSISSSSPIDQWPGGYIFLYWSVDEGPKWLRDMIKMALRFVRS